jgi:putative transposase
VLERFVVEEYHRRPHSETGQPPVTPWVGDGWIPRSPPHPDDLDLLLLTAATGRIVQRDGVRFAGTRYVSPVLAAYVGEIVTVRYDPRDAAELRIYHHDQYVCRAIAPELAAGTVTLQQLQDARTAQRKNLKQQLRKRRSLADTLPADHRYTPAATAPDPTSAPASSATSSVGDPTPRHRLRTYATD